MIFTLRGSEIAEFPVTSCGLDNTLSKVSVIIIRVTTDGTMVQVQVQMLAPRGFVSSTFSGNGEGVCKVLDSHRPGGEAARFCWRTLKGKENRWFL